MSQSLLERGLEERKGFLRGFEIEGLGLGGGGVVLRMGGLEGRRKGMEAGEAELLLESGGGFKEKKMDLAGEREKEEGLWLECKGKCEVDNEKLKASIVIVVL